MDCYDILGCYGKPYWEIYPYNDDTFRCNMLETDKLIEAISEELSRNDEIENDKLVDAVIKELD